MKWIWFALLFTLFSCKEEEMEKIEEVKIYSIHYISYSNSMTVTFFDTVYCENGKKKVKSGKMLNAYRGYEVDTILVPFDTLIFNKNI